MDVRIVSTLLSTCDNFMSKPSMTPDEFKDEMLRLKNLYIHEQDDEEVCHSMMDDVTMGLLGSLGYREGCLVFDETPKWYA